MTDDSSSATHGEAQRRLAAIVSADVVGYSRLMGRDESGTLARLKELRASLLDPLIANHGGRIVKTMGDGLLLEFPSIVNAVACCKAMQTGVEGQRPNSCGEAMRFRIGVHLGDVIADEEDVFGDGVNLAARLQEAAEPASLWIGEKLHYINQVRLKSHVDKGHPTTLYCTDEVSNVPEGVEIRPASEIMAIDHDIVAQISASFLSNVFRYKMIRATDAIWIDCDAFCHRPFLDEMTHIFAGHGFRGALNCGVVYVPPQSEVIDLLLDYYENLPEAPPWFNKNQRRKLDRIKDKPHAVGIYEAERTAFGPQAFTYFAKQTGDYERALPSSVLYPVPFQLNDVFFDPHGRVEGHFTEETLSVHLYTNGTRNWWRKHPPLEGSYVWRMCQETGILPEDALK